MDNFIPRRSAPLKEGRSIPFQYPPSRRRTANSRLIFVLVGLAFTCILAFYFISTSPGSATKIGRTYTAGETINKAPPITNPGSKQQVDSSIPVDHVPNNPPAAVPAKPEPHVVPDLKSEHTGEQASLVDSSTRDFGSRPGFGEAIQRVFDLLPDEIHQRELLRPFDGTGKEKLREVGLRTRAYKAFFEAWENLHLVMGDSSTYIRDDAMSYLRTYYALSPSSQSRPFPQALRNYESFRYFLTQLSTLLFPWTSPYYSDHMNLHASFHRGGRGIAMTAGDEQAPYLLASIPAFRELGCKLPIEIFYLGDSDLSEDFRSELEAMDGVTTRDLSQMVTDEGWRLAGWAGKPFTILYSSFREVIFVDADALFFLNPEVLFDDPDYKRTGALFFRDRLIMPESKKRWLQAVLPKPISKQVRQSRMWTGDSGHMQESGVVVVDKWKHFIALLLVSRMNGPDRDGKKEEGIIGIYDMVYGDKETFWIGWELVGDTEYSFHQGDAGIMGVVEPPFTPETPPEPDHEHDHEHEHDHDDDPHRAKERKHAPGHEDDYTICAPQLLHLDLKGKPLWFNGWLYHNKFAGREKQGGKFETYMKEPREILEPGAWQLEEGNVCCLSNSEVFEFSGEEKAKLAMMIGHARKVGSYVGG